MRRGSRWRALSRAEVLASERQTDRTTCTAFEGPVHRARVANKVCAGPRMAGEELEGDKFTFEPIARSTRHHDVPRIVGAAARPRHDMVQRGRPLVKANGAVYTALAAVAQRHLTHRAFVRPLRDAGAREQVPLTPALGIAAIAAPAGGRAKRVLAVDAAREPKTQASAHQPRPRANDVAPTEAKFLMSGR